MIITVFLKELKDTLRDRRTIMMMVVIPTIVLPIVMTLFVSISSSFEQKVAEKVLKMGLVASKQDVVRQELIASPKELGKMTFQPFSDSSALTAAVKADSIDIGVWISPESSRLNQSMIPIPVTVFYDATTVGMKDRAEKVLEAIQNKWRVQRMKTLKINAESLSPIAVNFSNVASDKEMIGKLAGGVLPYIFIAFGFLGCMYPAIDLFTGEKERGTIETLLTTPVARWKILFGKMGVVVLSGLIASTFSILGLVLAIEGFQVIDNPEVLAIIHDILSPSFLILLYVLLLPLTIFFAGVMIPIAIRAKSFKEAQSIISPLNILIVLPAMVGFFPGIELNSITALIPIVNVVLATKELIAGTLEWSLVAISFLVMVALAASTIFLSYKKFESETNIIG